MIDNFLNESFSNFLSTLMVENSYLRRKTVNRKLKNKAFAENFYRTSMGQFRCIFLVLALFIGVAGTAYAQKEPPAPTEKRHKGPPCDPGNGNGNGGGPSVPVGLCLPIDDYVYILMAVGVMYGCYKLRNFETA